MNLPIILIGPLGAGKSTVANLLAQKLSLPLCSVDEVRWAYYDEFGYDRELASRIAAEQGVRAQLLYSKPFEVQVVESVLSDDSHGIIDFGASNTIYDDHCSSPGSKRLLPLFPMSCSFSRLLTPTSPLKY
jgi:adenylate kinase family enzyme